MATKNNCSQKQKPQIKTGLLKTVEVEEQYFLRPTLHQYNLLMFYIYSLFSIPNSVLQMTI